MKRTPSQLANNPPFCVEYPICACKWRSARVTELGLPQSLSSLPLQLSRTLRNLHAEATSAERRRRGNGSYGVSRAVAAEGLEPGPVVEFSIVLGNEAVAANLHVVDTVDGVWERNDSPSPGDGAAVMPDVEDLNCDLGLQDTLAVVESALAVEGDGAKLEINVSDYDYSRGNLELTGKPAMKLMESEISTKSVSRVAAETSYL